MEPMSRTERAALCNTALEAGEQAPTLCGRWTVKDLVIHLLVRERDPLGAPGILVPQLERLTDRSARRLARQDFTSLVERVRSGPPKWSPMALPPLDRAVNTLEYFVHHEDIRRAATELAAPRADRARAEGDLEVGRHGRQGPGAVGRRPRRDPLARRGRGERTAVLRKGEDPAVVSGAPAELAMFLFGREQHTGLEFTAGDPALAVEKLQRGRARPLEPTSPVS